MITSKQRAAAKVAHAIRMAERRVRQSVRVSGYQNLSALSRGAQLKAIRAREVNALGEKQR